MEPAAERGGWPAELVQSHNSEGPAGASAASLSALGPGEGHRQGVVVPSIKTATCPFRSRTPSHPGTPALDPLPACEIPSQSGGRLLSHSSVRLGKMA